MVGNSWNEAETRAEFIDPALNKAGWGRVEGSRVRREYPITLGRLDGSGRRSSDKMADYLLEHRGIRLAIVEAKAWDKPLTEGVAQAKEYATKLDIPFAYSTHGHGLYFIDMRSGEEREINDFPTPDELFALRAAPVNRWRQRFEAVPFEEKGGAQQVRYYQEIAARRALEAIADGRNRILLTLATGTGKTFIAFQIAWKLFQSRWNLNGWKSEAEPSRRPRILFLADRNILANQARNDFSGFPDETMARIKPDEIKKKGRVPTNASVFFTIFQTFMSGVSADGAAEPYFGQYPPDFFDFIIIDECHRGGANDESSWRDILTYFAPAVQLGLTATPKRDDNVDTYRYFGDPVFTYSLKEGINDGYLTPFRVHQYQTTLDEYQYVSDDTVVEGDIEVGRRYEEKDFNRIIKIKEREAKRVELWMRQIPPMEKTLVFCATQDHALAVRDLVNQRKAIADPDYCARVTANDGAIGDQFLRDFQDNEKTIPTVLTTSQKLSTGVDARNVRHIVLMRPVNSMIEFKQIIGRGTRLYEGKNYFTIHDFVQASQKFSDPEWDGPPLAPSDPKPPKDPGDPRPPTGGRPGGVPPERPRMIEVTLADGKARTIQSMMSTTFWHPDGTPMSAAEFLESLYGRLPDFFKDEQQLRELWSRPDTRRKLLDGLAEKGFATEQLCEMAKIINAERSDLFDVLAYVRYLTPPVTRETRAQYAHSAIADRYEDKQRAFLDFVLGHYVTDGVMELEQEKLIPLLKLRYNQSVEDGLRDLGEAQAIGALFADFQQYLYHSAIS